jgi:hypothetical protein
MPGIMVTITAKVNLKKFIGTAKNKIVSQPAAGGSKMEWGLV